MEFRYCTSNTRRCQPLIYSARQPKYGCGPAGGLSPSHNFPERRWGGRVFPAPCSFLLNGILSASIRGSMVPIFQELNHCKTNQVSVQSGKSDLSDNIYVLPVARPEITNASLMSPLSLNKRRTSARTAFANRVRSIVTVALNSILSQSSKFERQPKHKRTRHSKAEQRLVGVTFEIDSVIPMLATTHGPLAKLSTLSVDSLLAGNQLEWDRSSAARDMSVIA